MSGLYDEIDRQMRLLEPLLGLRKTFLELGAGDGALARHVAGYVERVYALGVPGETAVAGVGNVTPVLSDGVSVPVPAGSVDVAYSSRRTPRLHPRETEARLANVYRALAPGGRYLCSAAGGAEALRALLRAAGFRSVRFYAGGWRVRVPCAAVRVFERLRRPLAGLLAEAIK